MSRTSNPTRPVTGSAEVQQLLRDLSATKRRRLEDWGYPIDRLAEFAARSDKQADAVDVLLAVLLMRPGYTHDDADVAAAERIAKRVGAEMMPYARLVEKRKAPPKPIFNIQGYTKPGDKEFTWRGMVAVFGGVFLLLVVISTIVVLLR